MPKLLALPFALVLCACASNLHAQGQNPSWVQAQLSNSAAAALPVEEAFQLKVLTARNGEISVRWDMPEGYYLYGSRLKFTATNGLRVGNPVRPNGVMKNDPEFGRVEVYRNHLTTTLPREAAAGGMLTVRFQGCAEKQNVCYPPVTRSFRIPAVSG